MEPVTILFKRNHPNARIPTRSHTCDAGYDIYSVEAKTIKRNTTVAIDTGLSLQIPPDYYCEIHTRSSFGKIGARTHLGIIDTGYRGNIIVFITTPDIDMEIFKGDRVAQLILRKREEIIFQETDNLGDSPRGANGFGSTGK